MRAFRQFGLSLAICWFGIFAPSASPFGGEDIASGLPWHHEDITKFALSGDDPYYPIDAKFTEAAAESIAWHADNIDSYLYNPIFWAQGGVSKTRTKAALVGFSELAKLHFDDTFTNTGLQSNWERYASGTLAGLYWASLQGPNGDLAAGHNILGVSFHAVQDFYSHSNWESEPERRCYTYFETQKDYRNGSSLFAGAYEKPAAGAPAHHGAYSLSCSVYGRAEFQDSLGVICSGYSPFQNANVCDHYRTCQGSLGVDIQLQNPLLLPSNATIYLQPQGIALDNTSLAKVQAKNRRLVDDAGRFLPGKDGMHFTEDRCPDIVRDKGKKSCRDDDTRKIFAGTKDVAIRATIEWANYLEFAMKAMGPKQRTYWNRLKSTPSPKDDMPKQFEDFSQLPYQFLSAGPYPTGNPSVMSREAAYTSNGWYLRLRIKTADEWFAGTNSDIYADVEDEDGKVTPFRLDYLPTDDKEGRTTNRLLVYNDFEAGDDDVYTIGPVAKRPAKISLRNQDKSAGDVFGAIYDDLKYGIDHTLTDLRQFVIGFAGGNADYVGKDINTYTVADLKKLAASASEKLEIRGGDEGEHDVIYTITSRPQLLSERQRKKGWIGIRVALSEIHTIRESKIDRGTNSDEPFVLFQITPLNGERYEDSFAYVSPPFEDMDDGERAPFPNRNRLYKDIRLPPEGFLVVAGKVYESDSENEFDRRTLLTEFVTNLGADTQRAKGKFFDALGASIAEDWSPESIEVFAFQRGRFPVAANVLATTRLEEIEGGKSSPKLNLSWRDQKSLINGSVEPVLELKNATPPARNVLEGEWFSDSYYCGAKQGLQKVRFNVSGKDGNTVEVIKTEAKDDACVGAGDVTFKGEFRDGDLIGQRYIVPPVSERPKPVVYPDGSPLDTIPDYDDPAIHPMLKMAGNYNITWAGSDEPPAKAVLHKGGIWQCADGEGGCWYQFTRDPNAKWAVTHHPASAGAGTSQNLELDASGRMSVKWDYSHLGHWGGESELQVQGDNAISGNWKYGEDKKGSETWTRAKAKITHIGTMIDGNEVTVPLGRKLTLDTKYVSPDYYMRGNRSQVELRLYGDNLWGAHQVFMPWSTDLEIAPWYYICEPGQYPTHSTWQVCEGQGGTRGIVVKMNVWSRAESGPKKIIFDGQEIPFELNVIGEPVRHPEWQDAKLEMLSCGILEEAERDYWEHPFKFTRSDPSKQ